MEFQEFRNNTFYDTRYFTRNSPIHYLHLNPRSCDTEKSSTLSLLICKMGVMTVTPSEAGGEE